MHKVLKCYAIYKENVGVGNGHVRVSLLKLLLPLPTVPSVTSNL